MMHDAAAAIRDVASVRCCCMLACPVDHFRLPESSLQEKLQAVGGAHVGDAFTLAFSQMKHDVKNGGYGSSELQIHNNGTWLAVKPHRSFSCRLRMLFFAYQVEILLSCGVVFLCVLLWHKW